MKKFVAIVVLFVLTIAFSVACAEIYPQTFVVGDVDDEHNVIVLIDYNENEWECFNVDGYDVGDIIAAIMDDNDTEIIFDDEIVDLRYAGYMEGWD